MHKAMTHRGAPLCLLVILSSFFTVSSLGEGHNLPSGTSPSLGRQPQELCSIGSLSAIKFVAVAGIGFLAGGALTIKEPIASALLFGL